MNQFDITFRPLPVAIFNANEAAEYRRLVNYDPWYYATKSGTAYSRYLLSSDNVDQLYVERKHQPILRIGHVVEAYEDWMRDLAEAWLSPHDWQAWTAPDYQMLLTTAPEYYIRAFLNAVYVERIKTLYPNWDIAS